MINEVEVSENREILIVLFGTVGVLLLRFAVSLPFPLQIKAPATETALRASPFTTAV